MNGYELTRIWFDFCFENPDKINPNHTAIYCFAIEHCNRLGWKEKFGFPTDLTMETLGIKSYNTYIKYLNDLVGFGFIKMVQKSKNQYTANIIALSNNNEAPNKALDKATAKHVSKQLQSTCESNDSINKQLNHETMNHETRGSNKKSYRFSPPSKVDVENYFIEKEIAPAIAKKESEKFWNFYDSKNWMVGKNKMKNWKSAISGWINRMGDFSKPLNNLNQIATTAPKRAPKISELD